jgi:hypothetical protein
MWIYLRYGLGNSGVVIGWIGGVRRLDGDKR